MSSLCCFRHVFARRDSGDKQMPSSGDSASDPHSTLPTGDYLPVADTSSETSSSSSSSPSHNPPSLQICPRRRHATSGYALPAMLRARGVTRKE